ncbi:MAG: Npt1/Npt2 family nucleotide transporter [Chlamydiota bacterium]
MGDSEELNPEFGRLRSFFWPIYRYELRKLLPMLLIFFLITFNYNVLRTMKDTLVINGKASGAEVIPFIKVWFMFPGAVLLTFVFTRLANRFNQETVFYSMISLFLLFFAVFTFVLYPNRDLLHPNDLADKLQVMLPIGLKGLIAAFRNWTFTLFYVMSEIWGNIVLSLLMWGFVNQVTGLGEAKRFYALFGVGINSSGIIAGWLSMQMCLGEYNPNLPFGNTAWEQTMILLISTVLAVGILIMVIFRWLNTKVLRDPRYYDPDEARKEQKVRGNVSMRDSFKYLMRSRYLVYLAVIVITYNVVINLVEVVWKHEVSILYPNKEDYNYYMAKITMIMGCFATFTSMFVAGNSVRRFGWSFTAMLTPGILLITSILFFSSYFAKEQYPDLLYGLTGMTPLAVVVFFGSLQNIMSRTAKYTVFDETREMALIPLSPDCKLKGKAVIDGVCSRLGKSSGSFIHQSLFIVFTNITRSMPYVAGLLASVIGVWIVVTRLLGKQFNALTAIKGGDVKVTEIEATIAAGSDEELTEQPA